MSGTLMSPKIRYKNYLDIFVSDFFLFNFGERTFLKVQVLFFSLTPQKYSWM